MSAQGIFGRVEQLIVERGWRAPVVAVYWPLPGEPDSLEAMHRWHAMAWPLALPRVVSADAPLVFDAWAPGQAVAEGVFGTRHARQPHPVRPQILVIPCLGFDARRHRLGYGGGYYDRSIAQLQGEGGPLLLIGVAWSWQEVTGLQAGSHDRVLDHIVTEAKVLSA